MNIRTVFFSALLVGLLLAGMIAQPTKADAPDTIRGSGQTATASIGVAAINGVDYRVSLTVLRDVASGTTTLIIQAVLPVPAVPGNPNVTRYTLRGRIASSDFTVAPDLTSATLSTTISTDTTNHYFDNAGVGFIAGLTINLTWTSDTIGNLVDTSVFNGRTVGNPGFAYRETYHQNGPHAEGVVAGTFGTTTVTDRFGTLDANRSFDIFQLR